MLVYLPALSCGFVNFDDYHNVVNNKVIWHLDGNFFRWAFTTGIDLWIPLMWLSLAVDYFFWGLNPFGYHLTNIILHSLNTGLVVLITDIILREWLGKRDKQAPEQKYLYPVTLILAGLLWGIHPLRVESVAWVTERKDVLNGIFAFSSIICYLKYVELKRCGAVSHALGMYCGACLLFLFSLMAKPVTVSLPLILLLADWYPLSRLSKETILPVLLEKLPFLLLSAAVSVFTLFFSLPTAAVSEFPFSQQLVISGNTIFEYCRLMLWPVAIIPYYEFPDILPLSFVIKTVVVAFVTGCSIWFAKKWPWFFVIWLSFVILTFPTLKFFKLEVPMAARYTYLPSVAPTIFVACMFFIFIRKSAPGCDKAALSAKSWVSWSCNVVVWRTIYFALPLIFLVCYAGVTQRLISVWRDTESLWTRVIDLNPYTTKYMDRGVYYILNRRPDAALADFSAAIDGLARRGKAPDYNAYAFRGVANMDLKRFEDAVSDFSRALMLKSHPTYYYYRGLAFQALGRHEEAEIDFNLAGPDPPPIDTF
jgi:hypothetical protein